MVKSTEASTRVWSALYIEDGDVRRLWFEAPSEEKARDFARRCGAGLEGASDRPDTTVPLPEAYDEVTTRKLLGGVRDDGTPGVSRSFLYKELTLGRLERVPGTRRLLITRASIEKWAPRN